MSSIHSESSLLMSRVLHQKDSSFDPRVFWSINALLITLLLIVLVWCFRGGAEKISNYLTREAAGSSDAIYLERLRERRERAAEEKKETPEQRLAKLKKSFQRNKVHMVVESSDFVEESVIEIIEKPDPVEKEKHLSSVPEDTTPENETEPVVDIENGGAQINEIDGSAVTVNHDENVGVPTDEDELANEAQHDSAATSVNLDAPGGENDNGPVIEHAVEFGSPDLEENNTVIEELAMNVVETGAPGYIKLRLASGKKRTVPNCCAVCLCCYEEGETVTWSSNRACKHAFHEECVMEWLIKMQDGTPCPCCRQEFTDLNEQKMKQKLLVPQHSFDVRVIHL